MGHYASEMSPGISHGPEVLEGRREEARSQAAFLWNELYPKYEKQGVWIDDRQKLVCPRCWATVPAILRVDHDEAVHG